MARRPNFRTPAHGSLGALALILALARASFAAPPTLDHLFPAGAARGTSVEVTAAGKFDRWPARGWASSPGLRIEAGAEKGKLRVDVAADAAPGVHWVRLVDDEGATAPRPFVVGILPELAESEPNDEPKGAQRIDRPAVTVNGRLAKTGDVDGFAVRLRRGQTLVASMEAHRRLGSPMDGVLQVATPDGFVLAHVDDDNDRDPRLVFEAPADGDYVVRAFAFPFVQTSTIRFAGAASYVYRLTLTTGGFVDHAFPPVVSRSGPGSVEVMGWNIPEAARRLEVEPSGDSEADDADGPVRLEHPLLGNPAEVRVVAGPAIVEAEPDDARHPQPITLPVAIAGRLDPPRDVDGFAFAATKGQRVGFRLESRSLGLPPDAVLRVADASGASLAEVDDAQGGFDPEIRFTAPADGTYTLTVRDLNGRGGPRHAYLLTAGNPPPDFALTLKADQFALAAGKPTEVVIAVDRREGYAEAIEVGLADRFDGVIAAPVTSHPSGPSARSVTLKLIPCECARTGPIRVVGVAADGRRRVARAAVAGLSETIDSAWLATPKPDPPAAKPK